jgi:hypothetical protein
MLPGELSSPAIEVLRLRPAPGALAFVRALVVAPTPLPPPPNDATLGAVIDGCEIGTQGVNGRGLDGQCFNDAACGSDVACCGVRRVNFWWGDGSDCLDLDPSRKPVSLRS